VLNLCKRRREDCLTVEGMNWPLTRLWTPALDRENRALEAIGKCVIPMPLNVKESGSGA
jgi:hypothetical protein